MNTQMIDIVFLAVIAVLLIYRLSKILGSTPNDETNNENTKQDSEIIDITDKVKPALSLKDEGEKVLALSSSSNKNPEDDPLKSVFYKIYSIDKTFHPEKFLQGAKIAFEMIVEAFVKGDEETLKELVSDKVFKKFHSAIALFAKNKQKLEQSIIGFTSVKIIDAELDGNDAKLTVEFVTEQSKVIMDEDGKIVEGDTVMINTVVDKWTFEKDLKSSSPNWFLTAVKRGG